MDDNVTVAEPESGDFWTNFSDASGPQFDWRLDWRLDWAGLYFPLALPCLLLQLLAIRVLWVTSVQRRFGQPTAGDLQQVLLTACCCSVVLLVIDFPTALEMLVGEWKLGAVFCGITRGLETGGNMMTRLVYLFLVARVCLNRPLVKAHRIFLVVAGLVSLAISIATGVFSEIHGLCVVDYGPYMAITMGSIEILLLLALFVLLPVTGCALCKRRRRITTTEFQPEPDTSDVPTDVSSAEFTRSVENVCVWMAALSLVVFMIRAVSLLFFDVWVHVFGALASAYLIDMILDDIGMLVAVLLFFKLYPGSRDLVKQLWREDVPCTKLQNPLLSPVRSD